MENQTAKANPLSQETKSSQHEHPLKNSGFDGSDSGSTLSPPPFQLQTAAANAPAAGAKNANGLPSQLKAGMESLSGIDMSDVKVKYNSDKPKQLQAHAYAQGSEIHLGPGQEQHLPHEAWHVVQQKQGRVQATTEANGAAINDNPGLEAEADAMGSKALQMKQQPGNLSTKAISANAPAQRRAFINGKQVGTNDKQLNPAMKDFVADTAIRDYKSYSEFKKHAAGKTDYIGNIQGSAKAGTWVRYSPKGINILGENHTLVKLNNVTQGVNSTNFIHERFSSDKLDKGSELEQAYLDENKEEFASFGVAGSKDKQQYGSESLFPKMGYALMLGLPYFQKKADISGISAPGYLGKPLQTYVRLASAHAADVHQKVVADEKAKKKVSAPKKKLSATFMKMEAPLRMLVAQFKEGGYLGDTLSIKMNKPMFAHLAELTIAFTDVMVEKAATESSSRLSKKDRKKLLAKGANDQEKETLFYDWRNHHFEDQVRKAARNGVRYAGMGQNHLKYLAKKGLPRNGHPYYMADVDLGKFENHTNALATKAVNPKTIK